MRLAQKLANNKNQQFSSNYSEIGENNQLMKSKTSDI